jgi:hypothetical protein
MSTKSDETKGSSTIVDAGRRTLLAAAGAASVALPLAAYLGREPWRGPRSALAEPGPRTRQSYWRGNYFVHENVDATRFESAGIVRAYVDGEWREFVNRPLGDDFVDWNIGRRLEILADPMTQMQCLDGPHSGCLATYGANRGDSVFTLNAAFKGFGFYPRESEIDDAIQEVIDFWGDDMMTILSVLRTFYRDRAMWDLRILSSLELYTTPEFETHSFLNQMANPVATICWLAIPGSFEVRAVPRLLHPLDPDLPDIDRKRLHWVNLMHDFFHGSDAGVPLPDPDNLTWIGCIYYNVEVFDNSPYPGPMGIRTTPAL